MELRALGYFVAVADEESFTRAAERCHVAQPSISSQIQALEKELGEPLFERLPRGITLSAGGHVLLPYARECLALAEAAKSEFAERAGLLSGDFGLGTVSGIERTLIPPLLRVFYGRYPGVNVSVTEGTSAPLLSLVAQSRLDAAIIARPVEALPATVSASTILSDQLVVAFDPERFSFATDSVSIAELLDHPIISYGPSSGLRPLLDNAFHAAGVPVRVNYAVNDVRLQVAFARQGVGVAISAGSDPALVDAPDLATRPLSPTVDYEKILIWRNDTAPRAPLRAFLQLWTELRAETSTG
jgi:DNA-binding transcriptional LysR family regulator